jgi:F-type H+-transporting ATPase subunit epsilon
MPLDLVIVTPEGQAFHDQVDSVVLPGTEGDFGVLPGHEPFLTALRIGPVEIARDGQKRFAAVSRGYAEVLDEVVTVMVGTCEFADEIDRERAEKARERSERQLEELRKTADGRALWEQYQDAYSRAVTRIAVSDRFKA